MNIELMGIMDCEPLYPSYMNGDYHTPWEQSGNTTHNTSHPEYTGLHSGYHENYPQDTGVHDNLTFVIQGSSKLYDGKFNPADFATLVSPGAG